MDSITVNRKYEGLPDLDSAPDIYETPELTDDRGTTDAAYSDDEFDDDDDDDAVGGISRARLRIDEARSRFLPATVDASTADFSDRVDGKRGSYKTSRRRERVFADGTRELGNASEDDEESLERRLARLKRETEEVKAEFAKRKAAGRSRPEEDGARQEQQRTHTAQSLAELSSSLDAMRIADVTDDSEEAAPPLRPLSTTTTGAHLTAERTYTVTYTPSYEQSHALAKAADFDGRLLALERALGLGSSALEEFDGRKPSRAVLPVLDDLQKQFVVLVSANSTGLDATARRVRTLAHEIQQLNDVRRAEAMARGGSEQALVRESMGGQQNQGQDGNEAMTAQADKIKALYGTLPIIDSLVPLLPPLLDRLRSLRSLHADAARAADALAEVEAKQVEMETDLRLWREGLEKVEAKIGENEATMQGNMNVVEGWVKDIEARMEKFSQL